MPFGMGLRFAEMSIPDQNRIGDFTFHHLFRIDQKVYPQLHQGHS
jgi:hypothetical protein